MNESNNHVNEISPQDRQRVVVRFNELLTTRFLRAYLGNEVERLVAACENNGSLHKLKVENEDLAELLLDLHGTEILRDRKIREKLVEALPLETIRQLHEVLDKGPPRGRDAAIEDIVSHKWTPGKYWATRFVTIVGLPLVLAGTPDGGAGPATEELTPYVPLPRLHDYQEALRDGLIEVIEQAGKGARALLSLPTGAGKTRTAVEALVQCLRLGTIADGHVLWIAQSEELCEQAVQAFREVWTHQTVTAAANGTPDPPEIALDIHRLWGGRTVALDVDRGIFVASIQKLSSLQEANPHEYAALLERVRAVVVDEAHHAIAPSYTEVFRALGFSPHRGSRALIGLTATPYRGREDETKRLISRFGGNLVIPPWENAVTTLRGRSILAKTEILQIKTQRRFSLSSKEVELYHKFNEIPDAALKRIGNDIERNRIILDNLLQIDEGKPVLFFACSVVHARAIALLLRRRERTAAVVTGETPRSLRRLWIDQFKRGEQQFLCNYGILTTGFDAPKVEVVVVGRPTSSVLLYEQMVGRGMRGPANGGTELCTVIDLVDTFPQFGEQMSYARYRKMWQEFASKGGLRSIKRGEA